MDTALSGNRPPPKKRTSKPQTTIGSLDGDILCIIFSSLGFFDLVRCSVVCKSWNAIINSCKLLQQLYCKLHGFSNTSSSSMRMHLEELAMKQHRLALEEGRIDIDQWKGHSVGVDQCRMKRGLVLTGVGDKVLLRKLTASAIGILKSYADKGAPPKGCLGGFFKQPLRRLYAMLKGSSQVMRLWSLERNKCVEEYSLPDTVSLVDFDFDESKIVGLVGTRICIWRRNGARSIFPSHDGTFMKGLCMRYVDPEAVVGCEDGTARVFDMYSRKCTRIIRMHFAPVTCLSLSEDQLIISGSSLGSITVSGLSSDQRVATLRSTNSTGIKTLCYNPCSHLVFAGTTAGYASCWDLRTMKSLWEARISPNVVYSLHYLQNDVSTLVVGGIDGVLRVLDQNTGEVLSSCVMDIGSASSSSNGVVERKEGRRLSEGSRVDRIPKSIRPPITCLAVGMKKVVTTHNSKYIRLWKFDQ